MSIKEPLKHLRLKAYALSLLCLSLLTEATGLKQDLMKKPDIFSDKTPSIFAASSKYARYKKNFDLWLPEYEQFCMDSGLLGRRLLEEYPKTGCKAVLDFDEFNQITNDLLGGHYSPRKNEIHIGQACLERKEGLFYILFHESIHALQYLNSASCSANMSYSSLPIVLSPVDQVMQIILEERDAWVKTHYFYYGFHYEAPIDDPVHARELSQQLIQSSADIMDHETHDDGKNFHEWYIDYAIKGIEDMAEWHAEYNDTEFEYVRLDQNDIWRMGNTLNINCFFERKEDASYPLDIQITDEQKSRITALEKRLGIEDQTALPTLSEGIQAHGLKYEAYLKNNLEKIRTDDEK